MLCEPARIKVMHDNSVVHLLHGVHRNVRRPGTRRHLAVACALGAMAPGTCIAMPRHTKAVIWMGRTETWWRGPDAASLRCGTHVRKSATARSTSATPSALLTVLTHQEGCCREPLARSHVPLASSAGHNIPKVPQRCAQLTAKQSVRLIVGAAGEGPRAQPPRCAAWQAVRRASL